MHKSLARIIAALLLIAVSSTATAQDIRYSWFDIAFGQQDVGKSASFSDIVIGQSVDIETSDGSGIRFRGSVGTWNNLFAYVDFKSSDIDVAAVVNNSQGQFSASDEFDFTSIRGGVGMRWPLTLKTDVYGLVTYDSTDLDFGSFAGEDFDTNEKDVGATLGVRSLFKDKIELRASVRYSGVGDVDISTGVMDADTLFGVGFGYELLRGLSITGDFESGQFSSWNIGFRLDLDEN
jgi:outer membrane protein with beta-barrel domain